jgi:hypothetical protein
MHRFTNIFVALFLAAGLAACGGGYSGFIIPVESDLKPWVAPEADELVEDGDEDEDDGEDYEDYEDEEGDEPAAAPAKPAAPKPAAAKPAAPKK